MFSKIVDHPSPGSPVKSEVKSPPSGESLNLSYPCEMCKVQWPSSHCTGLWVEKPGFDSWPSEFVYDLSKSYAIKLLRKKEKKERKRKKSYNPRFTHNGNNNNNVIYILSKLTC